MFENPFSAGKKDQARMTKDEYKQYIKEMVFLAEQAKQGDMKVLPGDKWGYHYKASEEERNELLRGLVDGKYSAEDVQDKLKPDALMYDINDLKDKGLPHVQSEIFEKTAMVEHYDYESFANFMKSMKGADADPETIKDLYDSISEGRMQKKLHDAYSRQGQEKIEQALAEEAEEIKQTIDSKDRADKIISGLKADWMADKFGTLSEEDRDQIISSLSGEEREIYKKLSESYGEYIQSGDKESFEELVDSIKKDLPAIERGSGGEMSESMQELDEELEEIQDEVDYPGTEGDPAIPPEDSDEYHTPPPMEGGGGSSQEKVPVQPIFQIEPGLSGYYISGRKSYYDVDRKVWSKKKSLTEYNGNVSDAKYTISGLIDGGTKSLPLPNTYALDESTLEYEGEKPKITRDQNGCFYLQSNGRSKFTISFGKEDKKFINAPIPEDTQSLYRGKLSDKTEQKIKSLKGSLLQKAEQARQYMLANHFYPGGGDLEKAQALQYKLRKESTGDTYIQALDTSEYLECYSANTKYIAMLRAANVPARLVTGYHAKGQKDGKTNITQNAGHAWSEVWDGTKWVRFDATPNPKPEDKNEQEDDKEKVDPAENAQDDGQESPQEAQESQDGGQEQQSSESSDSQSQSEQSSSQDMDSISDSDMESAQDQLDEASEQLDQMEQEKKEMQEKLQESDSFEDLKNLKDELDESEMLDQMKEDLEEMLDAKQDEMLEDLKKELDEMTDDGFMDEEKREELEKMLDTDALEKLDQLKQQIDREKGLYDRYENIKAEVEPLVDEWFEYFIEKLPREDEMYIDEDSRMRQGMFDRRSINRPRNIMFGTVKNPKLIKPNVKPLFLSSIMVDVSGSMGGPKLENARKLLIFYSELFTKIEQVFGYIRFSINTFADNITSIKSFDQGYDSRERYTFPDGKSSTVKVRLMTEVEVNGGTDMLPAVKRAAQELREESYEHPDHASAFYFLGDGGDTSGNAENIKRFMATENEIHGFGEHMRSAIMIGDESQRQVLGNLFGDDVTTVAQTMEDLIEESMKKFDDDIEEYMSNKTR